MININQQCEFVKDGYRPNVGIILSNPSRRVLWARRTKHDGWQFPQGGIEPEETVLQAAYRELQEEIGVTSSHVQLIGNTSRWLHYDLPYRLKANQFRRSPIKGQKQIWFLFKFLGCDSDVCLDAGSEPEFDQWKWVDYWEPAENIVGFKRTVYQSALTELEPYLSNLKY